ncbi:hypothetical protein BDV95DRAFT_128201 [Massariosphaeria phaeospora]|uniref:Uncharacterized protein n=1 Tax=Massariosphaeria phaeospora TaxID=100035 RepID=A0A7C8M5N5_9PLEO|nr:hypothetical protein BDV95DRAFT_128201 [Massariosphaeria phaeospora]
MDELGIPPFFPDTSFRHLTISDDQSAGGDLELRKLLALRGNSSLPQPEDEWGSFGPAKSGKKKKKARRERETDLPPPLPPPPGDPGFPPPPPGGYQPSSPHPLGAYQSPPVPEYPSHHSGYSSDSLSGEQADIGRSFPRNASSVDMDLKELKSYIGVLQEKAKRLETAQQTEISSSYQILYRITGKKGAITYLDHPEWIEGGQSLKSRRPIHNFDLYLERNKSISFIIYRDFSLFQTGDCDTLYEPKHVQESIYVVSEELWDAVQYMLSSRPEYASLLVESAGTRELRTPYLLFYHNRHCWDDMVLELSESEKEQLGYVVDYVLDTYGMDYSTADALLDKGKMSPKFINYLFKPGDILVYRAAKDKEHRGCVAQSWPDLALDKNYQDAAIEGEHEGEHAFQQLRQHVNHRFPRNFGPRSQITDNRQDNPVPPAPQCAVEAWDFSFDGTFVATGHGMTLKLPQVEPVNSEQNIFDIVDLNIYPIKYASEELVEKLQRRGEMFWKCRKRCLVAYRENNDGSDYQTNVI